MSNIILSVELKAADVATAFILISTGVVLLLDQPISTVSEVNNAVLTPVLLYFETV